MILESKHLIIAAAAVVLVLTVAGARTGTQTAAADVAASRPATQPGKASVQLYYRTLRMRVLLGVASDGEVNQQVEHLYESSQIKKAKLTVGAGTEGRILEVKDKACYVEVPATRVRKKKAAGEPARGWLPLSRRRTVFDVMSVLLANRKRSEVTVQMRCKDKKIISGRPFEATAAFTNTSNTIKTVHFGHVYLRNTDTGAPLASLGLARKRTVTKNIEPGKTITITGRLIPKLSAAATGGSYQLYAIYSIREGPDGPMPVRMVSDLVPVSIAEAEPIVLPLSSLSQISYADANGIHAAPVAAAYAKHKGSLISVQGFITIPGIPEGLATRPTLGLHFVRPDDALIALSGVAPPERGKPYMAIGWLSKDDTGYSLVVREWKNVKE